MLVTFILVIHGLISLALVAVILLQQSEGGGLGIGGGNAGGLMTARGAANVLTRATMILASLFVLTSVLLAVLATTAKQGHMIDTTLASPAPATPTARPLFPRTAPSVPGGPAAPTAPSPVDAVPLAH